MTRGALELIVWDVREGSAATLILPDGRVVWFDCGKGSFINGENFLPYKSLKSPIIDLLVLSHPHKNHLKDFWNIPSSNINDCLFNSTVSNEYMDALRSFSENRGDIAETFAKRFIMKPSPYCGIIRAYKFPFAPPLTLFGYWVDDYFGDNFNNYSVVVFLSTGKNIVCLTGDIEEEGFDFLLTKHTPFFDELLRKTNIFLAPHHGNKKGWFSKFSSLLRPEITIISENEGKETDALSFYENITAGHIVQKEIKDSTEWLFPPVFKKNKILTTKANGTIKIVLTEKEFSLFATRGL